MDPQITDHITIHGEIRSVTPEGEVEGYLCVWGDPEHRDSYDTYFDRDAPPDMALEFLPQPIYLEHGMDGAVGKVRIGAVLRAWADNVGIKFRGLLDKAGEHFADVVRDINAGLYKTSTGTAGHLAEFDDEGRFVTWPLVDLSLTKTPAEPRMPAVNLIRSEQGHYIAEFSQPNQAISTDNAGATGDAPIDSAANAVEARGSEQAISVDDKHETNSQTAVRGNHTMKTTRAISLEMLGLDATATPDQIYAALVDLLGEEAAKMYWQSQMGGAAADPAADPNAMPEMMSADGRSKKLVKPATVPAAPAADGSELTALRAEFEALKKAQMTEAPAPQDKSVRSANAPAATVSEPRKYWGRSLDDLMFAYEIEKARGIRPSEEFVRVIAGRTAHAFEKADPMLANPAVRSLLPATRSDEIVTSTNTGNGDEWIGVAYSGTLWEKARNSRIYQELVSKGMRVEEVAQGMETVTIFTEGADPTVYTITQSADLDATGRATVVVPVTPPGTGQVIMTPGYLGMAVSYTSVFEEDSLIAASSQMNKQMSEKAEETYEQLFINGDTASTLNVNYDGGTANAAQYFLASNGARKYALVTGSSTKRDGGTLDEDDYRATIALFPSAIRTRKKQMAFIIDPDTHNTSLGIAALKTEDVRQSVATINSGVLQNIWGVDVYESGFLPLTDTDGKVTYNAAGTVGTILGIYAPYWAMGWKRRVTFETSKDILAQTNLIVATFRLGFLARGAGAAVATYNLTIA